MQAHLNWGRLAYSLRRVQNRSVTTHERCDICPETKQEPYFKPPTSVKVAVINSISTVGRITNLLLKQDPLIRELRIFCRGNTAGLAADLRAIPTSTKVFHFTGANLHTAIKNVDIVLCVGAAELHEDNTDEDVFEANKNYIQNVARATARNCPEAVVGISVYPINSTVPLFAEIMKQHGVFCPNKILGVSSLYTMRARSVTACMLGVNPSTVSVNVLGGGTPNTIVPLISSASPAGHCLANRSDEISLGIANMDCAVRAVNKNHAVLSAAHANAHFVHQVAKGLTGKKVEGNVFLRNTALYGLKFSTLPVEFGLNGVSKMSEFPRMSKTEIARFDRAIPFLHKDIEIGEKAALTQLRSGEVELTREERIRRCCT